MSSALYEVISLGMRYWFALLGVLIVVRTFIWLLKEHRERHRRLHHLPDAGTVGRLLVLDGGGELEEGTELVLPYEGTLGSLRTCDVFLPGPEVAGEHLDFSFQPQLGMLLYPRQGMTCVADGEEMNHRSPARKYPLRHGSILEVGGVRLRLRLFEGLDTGGSAVLLPDEEEVPTIPNEGYASTAELPVVHPDGQNIQDPPDLPPRGSRPVPPAPAPQRPLPPAQPGAVVSRQGKTQPDAGTPAVPKTAQPAKDPFAHTDRQRIVSIYENTDEAGEPQERRWRSHWRRDNDA